MALFQLANIRSRFRFVAYVSLIAGAALIALGGWLAVHGISSKDATAPRTVEPSQLTRNALAAAIGFKAEISSTAVQLSLATVGAGVVTEAEWAERLSDPKFWADVKRRKSGGGSGWNPSNGRASGLTKDNPSVFPPNGERFSPGLRDSDSGDRRGGSTYRTMCVRLCDGFYWPVSFSTTSNNFDKDSRACESSCGGSKNARLFVYPNPGGSTEDLEDTDGVPYKKLPKAFAFRTSYDEGCKCRAHPWEEASLDQHKLYALETKDAKKDPSVKKELEALRKKMAQDASSASKSSTAAPGKQSNSAADAESLNAAALVADPVKRMSRAPANFNYFRSLPEAKLRADKMAVPVFVQSTPLNGEAKVSQSSQRKATTVRVRLGARGLMDVQLDRPVTFQRGAEVLDTSGLRALIVRR